MCSCVLRCDSVLEKKELTDMFRACVEWHSVTKSVRLVGTTGGKKKTSIKFGEAVFKTVRFNTQN